MKEVEVIGPPDLDSPARHQRPAVVVYYPVWLFEAKLSVRPVLGSAKEKRLLILVDALDGVAELFGRLPELTKKRVEDKKLLTPTLSQQQAAASASKQFRRYALAKYRGLSPTKLQTSSGRLVYKVFYVLPNTGRKGATAVFDTLTGRETEFS